MELGSGARIAQLCLGKKTRKHSESIESNWIPLSTRTPGSRLGPGLDAGTAPPRTLTCQRPKPTSSAPLNCALPSSGPSLPPALCSALFVAAFSPGRPKKSVGSMSEQAVDLRAVQIQRTDTFRGTGRRRRIGQWTGSVGRGAIGTRVQRPSYEGLRPVSQLRVKNWPDPLVRPGH